MSKKSKVPGKQFRRSFTEEFKRDAVNLVVNEGYTKADAARVELAFPGASVGGANHVQKARDSVKFLSRWPRET